MDKKEYTVAYTEFIGDQLYSDQKILGTVLASTLKEAGELAKVDYGIPVAEPYDHGTHLIFNQDDGTMEKFWAIVEKEDNENE